MSRNVNKASSEFCMFYFLNLFEKKSDHMKNMIGCSVTQQTLPKISHKKYYSFNDFD